MVGAGSSALRVRFACVSSAPLGVPVVPEVYRITASSSSPAWSAFEGAGTNPASNECRSGR